MTIKDAVEYYNTINDKIEDVKNTLKSILNQDRGPLGNYSINPTDMAKVATYLSSYMRILEEKLEDDFK